MALNDFISKVIIAKGQEIDIPENAKSCTPKKKNVYFYRNSNGQYEIKKDMKIIYFPEFEEHKFNTYYGNPVFYNKKERL